MGHPVPRRLCAVAIGAALALVPLSAQSSKQLLSASDFSFVGAFVLPASAGGGDAKWGRTLTHRYVNGQLRLVSMAGNSSVYEVTVPALKTAAPFNEAPIARVWGDVSRGKRWTDRYGLNSGFIYGLYWDEPDKRLYWSYGDTYNTTDPDDPSVGYSLLNDSTGTATAAGAWRFWPDRGAKATMGGVTAIPKWFADAYTGGKRLGAGFGGYWSIVSVGPAHMGPALAAFAPPTSANPDRSGIAYTDLVGYPYSATPYSTPDRAHRDTAYTNEFDFWNPKNGVGYWSWSDWLWQGGIWIDTADRTGLVFFPTLGNGRTWYETSTLHAQNSSHWAYVYSPADLAQVAQGTRAQWQIQAAATWPMKFPNLTYPLPGWADEPWQMVIGTTFDTSTNLLYIAVRFASQGGTVTSTTQTVVYVYKIAGGTTSTAPSGSTSGSTGGTTSGGTTSGSTSGSTSGGTTSGGHGTTSGGTTSGGTTTVSPSAGLKLATNKTSVALGSTYTLSYSWTNGAAHNVRLDGVAPPFTCSTTVCSGSMIKKPTTTGTKTHTLSATDGQGKPYTPVSVTVTVVKH